MISIELLSLLLICSSVQYRMCHSLTKNGLLHSSVILTHDSSSVMLQTQSRDLHVETDLVKQPVADQGARHGTINGMCKEVLYDGRLFIF